MLDVGITPVADWLCVVAGRINETKQFGAFIGLLPVSNFRRILMEKTIGKFWAKPAEQRIGPSKIGAIPDVCANISVGICRVLKARHGVKLDRGVVRVVGPNTEQGCRDIDAAVSIVIDLLNEGKYDGPERIEASRVLAGEHNMKCARKRWNLFGIGTPGV